jgi:hypothetical protein
VLTCVECGTTAIDAGVAWEAHLAYDPREDEASFVVVFCPWCAAREFGNDVEQAPQGPLWPQ